MYLDADGSLGLGLPLSWPTGVSHNCSMQPVRVRRVLLLHHQRQLYKYIQYHLLKNC